MCRLSKLIGSIKYWCCDLGFAVSTRTVATIQPSRYEAYDFDILPLTSYLTRLYNLFSFKMGTKQADLSHEEVWDDSALIDSWNEALQEYKVSFAFEPAVPTLTASRNTTVFMPKVAVFATWIIRSKSIEVEDDGILIR